MRRVSALAFLAVLAIDGSARAQVAGTPDVCTMLTLEQSDRPVAEPDGSGCSIAASVAGVTIQTRLKKTNPQTACVLLDDRRRADADPGAIVGEWVPSVELKPARSSWKSNDDHSHRDPEVPGQPIRIHIHPASYSVAFCQGDYYFLASILHLPSRDGNVVSAAARAAVENRAENTLRRIRGGGELGRADAEKEFLDALGPGIVNDDWSRLLQGGGDPMVLARQVMFGSRAMGAAAEFRQRLKAPLSNADETRLEGAINVIKRAAGLSAVLDVSGRPAFPVSAANLRVLIELTVAAATNTDPVSAHQAATAATRYAQMVYDLDMRALRDRNPVPSARPLP